MDFATIIYNQQHSALGQNSPSTFDFSMTASQTPAPDNAVPRKLWKTALFLVGSLAFSGVALALWNRKDLSRLRNPPENAISAGPPPELEEEIS